MRFTHNELSLWGMVEELTTGGSEIMTLFEQGFQETVFQVSDAAPYIHLFTELGHWKVIHHGNLDFKWQQLWKHSSPAHEWVLSPEDGLRGSIRLICQQNPATIQARSDAQAWEVGGFLDINIRIRHMEKRHQQLQQLAWRGSSNPVHWHWTGSEIKEWLAHGPDGVSIAFIERIAPALQGFGELTGFSRVINSTQIVSDLELNRHFYEKVLGFHVVRHSIGSHPHAGENVFGLPHALIESVPHEVIVLHPTNELEGSIELIQFKNLASRNFSSTAYPANLGIAALRFPVTDIEALNTKLAAAGIVSQYQSQKLPLLPYGEVLMTAVRMPDGAWLEFYQL